MDVLKDDLLVLLDCPEWPAAEMVLRLLVQIMVCLLHPYKLNIQQLLIRYA